MIKKSAGILVYRKPGENIEVLLVHPGGPYWRNKDDNAWSVPKGEPEENEELFRAAQREFHEETGFSIEGDFTSLEPVKQQSGKIIYTWAVEGDADPYALESNSFEMEWPPNSKNKQLFPEVDKAGWFSIGMAKQKICKGQIPILEQLEKLLSGE